MRNLSHEASRLLIVLTMALIVGISSSAACQEEATQIEFRTWTSATGNFSVKAKMLTSKDGSVTLQKENGLTIKVPIEKLSVADREFVEGKLGVNDDGKRDIVREVMEKRPESFAQPGPAELPDIPYRSNLPFAAVRYSVGDRDMLLPAFVFDFETDQSIIVIPKQRELVPPMQAGNPAPFLEKLKWWVQEDLQANQRGEAAEFHQIDADKQITLLKTKRLSKAPFEPALRPQLIAGAEVTVVMAVPRQGKNARIDYKRGKAKIGTNQRGDSFEVIARRPDKDAIGFVLDRDGKAIGVIGPDPRYQGHRMITAKRVTAFYDSRVPSLKSLRGYWTQDGSGKKQITLIATLDRKVSGEMKVLIADTPRVDKFWTRDQQEYFTTNNLVAQSVTVKLPQKAALLQPANSPKAKLLSHYRTNAGKFDYYANLPIEFDEYRSSRISLIAKVVVGAADKAGTSNLKEIQVEHINHLQLPLLATSDYWKDPYLSWNADLPLNTDWARDYPYMSKQEGPKIPAPKLSPRESSSTGQLNEAGQLQVKVNAPITKIEISADESVMWTHAQEGNVNRIELPTLTKTHQLSTSLKSNNRVESPFFTNSKQGLLVGDQRGFFVLDHDTLKPKRWYSMPYSTCLTSSPNLPFAFVLSNSRHGWASDFDNQSYLTVIDLRTGKTAFRFLNRIAPTVGDGFKTSQQMSDIERRVRQQLRLANDGKVADPESAEETKRLRANYEGTTMVHIKASPDGKHLFGTSDCLNRFRINDDGSLSFEERSPLYITSQSSQSIWISGDGSHLCSVGAATVGNNEMKRKFGKGQLPFVAATGNRNFLEIFPTGDLSKPVRSRERKAQIEFLSYLPAQKRFVFEDKQAGFPERSGISLGRYLPKTKQWILHNNRTITLIDVEKTQPAEMSPNIAIPTTETRSLVTEKWNEGIFEFAEIKLAGVEKSTEPKHILREKDGSSGQMILPVWSNDGNFFFLVSPQGLLRKIEVDTGNVLAELNFGKPISDLTMTAAGLLAVSQNEQQGWVVDPENLAIQGAPIELMLAQYAIGSPAHSLIVTKNTGSSISLYELVAQTTGNGSRIEAKLLQQMSFNSSNQGRFFASQFTTDGKTFYTASDRFELIENKLVQADQPYRSEYDQKSEWKIANPRFTIQTDANGGRKVFSIDNWETPLAAIKSLGDPRFHLPSDQKIMGIDSASKLTFLAEREKPMRAFDSSGVLKYEFKPIPRSSVHSAKYSFPPTNGKAFLWIIDEDSTRYNARSDSRDRVFIIRHVPRK